jgi:lipopolysaccharide assembly outer membrane protein LptD (OstA)
LRFIGIAIFLLTLVANTAAFAFDTEVWLAKREILTREAERLRDLYRKMAMKVEDPAADVLVPIETFEDGSVKTSVEAKKVKYFLKEGLIWAENVVVKNFNSKGEVEIRIDARNCLIDRMTKSGWADGYARICYGKSTSFVGKDVYFSSKEEYVIAMHDSKIESKDLKFGGQKPWER